jgi:hypothetical protein
MSIFGSIMSKIFGHPAAAADAAAAASSAAAEQAAAPAASAAAEDAPAASAPVSPPVDVAAVLTDMASKSGEQLNWRQSIVDLMKLLGLDSSLSARTELAQELHYTGDTNDSAKMNVWLHQQVMQKLADNGGKVPDDLKS